MSGEYDYLNSPEYREQRQRERLCSAFFQSLSDHGYEKTTVARVSELSGCTQETFHRYYEDLVDCFCDACSHTLHESRSATVTAWLTVHGWSERLRRSCQALLDHVEDHPAAARAVLVTSLDGGPEVTDHVRDVVAFHERALVMAFQLHPQGFATSRLTPRALTGGMRHVIYLRMRQGRECEIAELADDLHAWIECHRSVAAARLPIAPGNPVGQAHGQPAAASIFAGAVERARVLDTIAALMLQDGRESIDDATVARFAGVAAARFRNDFGGVSACLDQMVGEFVEQNAAAIGDGAAQATTWAESVWLGIAGSMHHLRANQALTRLVSLRLSLVPAVAATRYAALPSRIVSAALREAPPSLYAPGLLPDALVGAVGELLSWVVAQNAFDRLPALGNHIAFFLLAPHLGGEDAAKAVIASGEAQWLRRQSGKQ